MSSRLSPRCGTVMWTRRGSSALAGELLAQGSSSSLAVFEVDGDVDVARNVGLAEIELLEQRGEEFAGMEGISGEDGRPRPSKRGHLRPFAGERCGCPPRRAGTVGFVRLVASANSCRRIPAGLPRKIRGGRELFRPRMWNRFTASIPVFVVIAEDVGVVAFGGGDALLSCNCSTVEIRSR
jgi:hypothetical protein